MKNTIAKKTEGYGYKYTELADINKYCLENEITYYQEVETSEINQKDYIVTYITKDGETTKHRGCQIVQAILSGIKNPVQEYGSSLTYCRRYSLLMALGLATEDDDAQSLTEPKEPTEEEAKEYEFTFGKNKGRKLIDVIEENQDYIDWLVNNSNDTYLLKCIELLTGQVKPNEEELKDRIKLLVEFKKLVAQTNTDEERLKEHYGVELIDDLTNEQLLDAKKIMNKKVK
jgi:uncharacterized protein (DUF3820 family)